MRSVTMESYNWLLLLRYRRHHHYRDYAYRASDSKPHSKLGLNIYIYGPHEQSNSIDACYGECAPCYFLSVEF